MSLFSSSVGCWVSRDWCGFLLPLTPASVKSLGWHLCGEFRPVPGPSVNQMGHRENTGMVFSEAVFSLWGKGDHGIDSLSVFKEGNVNNNQSDLVFTSSCPS